MRLKKPATLMALALVASISVAGIAAAAEPDEDGEAAIVTPQIIVDEENGLILIALPIDGELPECGDEEAEDPGEVRGDAVEPADEMYGPGDCIEIVIEHPSGKTHHGAVVSSVAKNLHPSTLNGIKKGEVMRYVAKTGKVGDGDEAEPKGRAEKVEKDKVKKDKSERFRDKADRFEAKGEKFKDKAEKFREKADRFEQKAGRDGGR